jgi:hypothetical protein
MEDHILKTRKVKEPAFSVIYVWIDPHNEGFESYMKKHMLRMLGWACSNEDLKTSLHTHNGDTQLVIRQLKTMFYEQFDINISYLRELYGPEIVKSILLLIELFMVDCVQTYAAAFRPSSAGNMKQN